MGNAFMLYVICFWTTCASPHPSTRSWHRLFHLNCVVIVSCRVVMTRCRDDMMPSCIVVIVCRVVMPLSRDDMVSWCHWESYHHVVSWWHGVVTWHIVVMYCRDRVMSRRDTGGPGVVPVYHALLLPRRSRGVARVRHHPQRHVQPPHALARRG